jgi:hypothetical protein
MFCRTAGDPGSRLWTIVVAGPTLNFTLKPARESGNGAFAIQICAMLTRNWLWRVSKLRNDASPSGFVVYQLKCASSSPPISVLLKNAATSDAGSGGGGGAAAAAGAGLSTLGGGDCADAGTAAMPAATHTTTSDLVNLHMRTLLR